MRRLLLLAVGALLWTAAAPASALADEALLRVDEVDTSAYPRVSMLVTAPTGLAGEDVSEGFSVAENGGGRPVAVTPLASESLEVLLLVDTSGSMIGSPMRAAKAAATQFVNRMPPTTRIAVMGFGSAVQEVVGFSDEPERVVTALDTLAARGETALYDAVMASVEMFDAEREARRFIILLTDGGDTVSSASLAGATAALGNGDIGLYAIALDTEESDRAALEQLTAPTGGRVVEAADAEALSAVYDQVASELASQYLVVYLSGASQEASVLVRLSYQGVDAATEIEIDLPAAPPVTTGAENHPVATLPEDEISLTASPTYQVEGPGLLESHWSLTAGSIAVFLALVIALIPVTATQSRGVSLDVAGTRISAAGSMLSSISDRAQSAAERLLRRRGRDTALDRMLDNAGVTLRPGEFAVLVMSAAVTAFAIGLVLGGTVAGLLMVGVALVGSRLILTIRTDRRRNAFADQLDGTLQLIAGSLRAGYGLLQAVNTVAAEAPSPTKEEFGRIVVEARLGRDLVDALDAMADRVGNMDFDWVVQAIRIQREVGGDLAELLDTVSSTIRDRSQIRRHAQALSAEGRISAFILIALPFAIAFFVSVASPGYLGALFETTVGKVMLLAGVVMMGVGIAWIRRIIRLDF